MSKQFLQHKYQILEKIGSGSFGSVRKVLDLSTNTYLVRKEIKFSHMSIKERQQLINECKILSSLKHPNIVEFVTFDYKDGVVYIYMEYCDGGDLSHLIRDFREKYKKKMPEYLIWRILVQISLALWRCHYGLDYPHLNLIFDKVKKPESNNHDAIVIHRDIKPGNIFLTNIKDGYPFNEVMAKLGDFGLAKSLKSKNQFATTYVGTPYYMSPELLKDKPYSPLSDVWSLGCCIYEMCSLRPPFKGAKNFTDLENRIVAAVYEPVSDFYSKSLRNIIDRCITVDLRDRYSVMDILNDIQAKIMAKSLQLELFEKQLLAYEKELVNIEKHLEQRVTENRY
ncbi:related to Serine/threonine-protein kinase KIN3 [Saccharomycodes ludwigii]|uniref:non-specific serine/threonine protein kinase n=1 Tax=Saccharomycodes ludwigii TaxID=36035 RepID=A0A376B7X7_9ASCO|nr:hypothetical protein SCDLUD_005101 [Saccharomycodes ludwigii]KAH3898766.1 hypothetical protein SCDLUD_005101 [Saccharomycodes ludwigii]SSD60669.1 related to Serine/threonine-protein kinase KIN3 [Saccharomycodes ludwigii]